jgi:CDP-diacylglycerol--glycerol-3-phosphate 3-phosphatidyltransferase
MLLQWSLAVFIFAAITDWYDGWLARRWGYVTRWGAFLDPLADKVLTSAALLAYAYLGLVSGWMVWIIVIRDAIITILRSYAEYKGKPVDTSKLAKIKTFAQYVLIYYLLIFYVAQNTPSIEENFSGTIKVLLNYSFIYFSMVIITGISLWTGIMYFIDNWKIFRTRITIKRIWNHRLLRSSSPLRSFPVIHQSHPVPWAVQSRFSFTSFQDSNHSRLSVRRYSLYFFGGSKQELQWKNGTATIQPR